MSKSLLILGMGGYGAVVLECAQAMEMFDEIAFLDDKQTAALDTLAAYEKYAGRFTHAYPALGKNSLRLEWAKRLSAAGFELPVLVHPKAYVSPSAIIGEGACILANATVCAKAELSKAVIVNAGAVADHHCVLSEGVHVAPGGIVKAGCFVEPCAKIESGEVVFKAER